MNYFANLLTLFPLDILRKIKWLCSLNTVFTTFMYMKYKSQFSFQHFFLPDGGENARMYFSYHLRDVIVEELHDATDEEKEKIWQMLQDNSVIAR